MPIAMEREIMTVGAKEGRKEGGSEGGRERGTKKEGCSDRRKERDGGREGGQDVPCELEEGVVDAHCDGEGDHDGGGEGDDVHVLSDRVHHQKLFLCVSGGRDGMVLILGGNRLPLPPSLPSALPPYLDAKTSPFIFPLAGPAA